MDNIIPWIDGHGVLSVLILLAAVLFLMLRK